MNYFDGDLAATAPYVKAIEEVAPMTTMSILNRPGSRRSGNKVHTIQTSWRLLTNVFIVGPPTEKLIGL